MDFFAQLWNDYVQIAPQAARLRACLEARGETIVNDHVAFRTFDRSPLALEHLERHLLELGYRRYEPYQFEDKKLRAWGYLLEGHPRVFLSELETRHFSEELQAVVDGLCAQVDPSKISLSGGRLWEPVTYEVYQRLAEESEYAGWVAALGLRANHFTVSVNHLTTFEGLPGLLDFLEEQGFPLNMAGGRIKGTPEVLLEQASTLADRQPVEFADGTHSVPTCYYEFAKRYPDADGKLYDGFVAASADKIFESTNR